MRVFNLDPLDLVRYHGQALLWDRALRGALAVAGPSLLGVALGDPELGLIATLCALWPWINDLGGDLNDRLINMATSGDAILIGGLLAFIAGDELLGAARHAVPLRRRHRLGPQHQPRLRERGALHGIQLRHRGNASSRRARG